MFCLTSVLSYLSLLVFAKLVFDVNGTVILYKVLSALMKSCEEEGASSFENIYS